MEHGFPVRLCFDPIIYCPDWRTQYDAMLDQVRKQIDMEKVWDVSVGSFRISQDYMKKLKEEKLKKNRWFDRFMMRYIERLC